MENTGGYGLIGGKRALWLGVGGQLLRQEAFERDWSLFVMLQRLHRLHRRGRRSGDRQEFRPAASPINVAYLPHPATAIHRFFGGFYALYFVSIYSMNDHC